SFSMLMQLRMLKLNVGKGRQVINLATGLLSTSCAHIAKQIAIDGVVLCEMSLSLARIIAYKLFFKAHFLFFNAG
ncbi:MAG: hypothetical protein MJE68_10030, partial [Proteobacteria bacterium]|nr:hypothetical protein [Pseudomonadota bacterium]